MRTKYVALFSYALMAASGSAGAQAPPLTPAAQAAPPGSPNNCAPMQPTQPVPPRGTIAPEGTTGQSAEPLGDRLAKSDGVLCLPAGVDPEMRAPTPDAGNTPVIPPPGSPGGDPRVRPK